MKLRDQTAEVNSMEGYSKQEISVFKEQFNKSYEEHLRRITEMVFYGFPCLPAYLFYYCSTYGSKFLIQVIIKVRLRISFLLLFLKK